MTDVTPLGLAIADLPDTEEGIARFLTGLGIRGVRSSQYCCPIAAWLRSVGFQYPEVESVYIHVWTDERGWDDLIPPPALASFIARFDAGAWPELDADDRDPFAEVGR